MTSRAAKASGVPVHKVNQIMNHMLDDVAHNLVNYTVSSLGKNLHLANQLEPATPGYTGFVRGGGVRKVRGKKARRVYKFFTEKSLATIIKNKTIEKYRREFAEYAAGRRPLPVRPSCVPPE